ncbi:MAG: hypothetical protein KDK64_01110, partial [Chlamydiia bacterium]|nr:hypothetical protein [Chlamydiia bacterium]
ILRSQRFQAFLDEKKKAYDVVLLSIPSNLQDSLPKAFLSGADIMALYLEGHSFAELQPYFAWESDGHSLAFV